MTAPRSFVGRFAAARAAFFGAEAPDVAGIAAWAHVEIASVSIGRLADDDDGPRLAIQCAALRHPLWRPSSDAREEIERRVRHAWPELPADEVRRVLAHLDARVRAELLRPARGPDQQEVAPSRRSWVHGWRFDAHDAEVAR
ncbi:hypothetical protein [Xanthomonas sp. SHU 199]|uniref:hypothetical protein n=1 Tax=Xanthomonas sp. SHU 199 TaxID=1591174 RepID=UPI0003705BDB|nr:hypothetical protein [Xanthomonas sp. SHU 199]